MSLKYLAVGEHVDFPIKRPGQKGSIRVTACNWGKMAGQKLITQTIATDLPEIVQQGHLCGSNSKYGNAVRVTRIS
jgi:hypothetical protein